MLFTVVAGDAAAAAADVAAATATFIAQALALLFVFIKSTKQLQFNIKNNNKQQPESCGKASCSMLQYAAATATASAAAVAAHSHCSYCILAVNYLPLCLALRGRGRIEKSEDSSQENVGESRRRWSDQLLLLLPACSSIENVLLHASTVNACQFLLLLLLPLHLRLILQQLPTSCGICANVNKLINCLYSAVDVDDFYRRCI